MIDMNTRIQKKLCVEDEAELCAQVIFLAVNDNDPRKAMPATYTEALHEIARLREYLEEALSMLEEMHR